MVRNARTPRTAAVLGADEIQVGLVAHPANKSWSISGAERSQLVAAGGNRTASKTAETGANRCRGLRPDCRSERMASVHP
jgi:hypothetical protein